MAARLQIASVGEYCDDKEDFESYTERLSAWLVVNGVTDEQKKSMHRVGDVLNPTIHLMYVGLKRQFVMAVNRRGV